jgi:hypothetical protein
MPQLSAIAYFIVIKSSTRATKLGGASLTENTFRLFVCPLISSICAGFNPSAAASPFAIALLARPLSAGAVTEMRSAPSCDPPT